MLASESISSSDTSSTFTVTQMMIIHPNVLELELNPVFVYVDRVIVVDATVYVGSIG